MMIGFAWCLLLGLIKPVLPTDDSMISCRKGLFQYTQHTITVKLIVSFLFLIIPPSMFVTTNIIILMKVR